MPQAASATSVDGAIEVSIACEAWRSLHPDIEALVRVAAAAALRAAASGYPAGCGLVLDITLTDDSAQRVLNRDYRGRDASTNVLSFPLVDAPGAVPAGAPVLLGDVVLAVETVAREAVEQDKPPMHHVQHLVVHGVLHLLGFDHEKDADAAMMEAREVEILKGLGVPDPYRDPM